MFLKFFSLCKILVIALWPWALNFTVFGKYLHPFLTKKHFSQLYLQSPSEIFNDVENKVAMNINFESTGECGLVYENNYDFDPYADMLDFNKPLDDQNSTIVMSASTIKSLPGPSNPVPTYSNLVVGRSSTGLMTNFKRWDQWDEFMEAELGDIDAEITKDSDRWIQEMRDLVELKRGFAIWSNRSDKEIQKEMKKSQANRGLVIPQNVAMVITAVYLEKTHTMKAFREEEELACLEYRKWIMEQKKKSKKDPVISAKVEVSKKWLLRHPSTSSGGLYSSLGKKGKAIIRKKPSTSTPFVKKPATLVVLDDIVMESPSGLSSALIVPSMFSNTSTSSTTSPLTNLPPTHPMMSPSVQNWNKTPVELLRSPTNPSGESNAAEVGAGFRPSKGNVVEIFKVDDTAMYIPNYCAPNTDYYVVL
mmetsp:Transcript_12581/g.17280  ORF Transcript_12581/g.17280 Transcript_12581/m.17280 type:complete len:420 (+) Transcript_12581:37-1296(+)